MLLEENNATPSSSATGRNFFSVLLCFIIKILPCVLQLHFFFSHEVSANDLDNPHPSKETNEAKGESGFEINRSFFSPGKEFILW